VKITENLKDLGSGMFDGLILGIILSLLLLTFLNSHKNRVKINEIANSQTLIIELIENGNILFVDSLTFTVNK